MTSAVITPSKKVSDQIRIWREKLIDFSRRNRLLYFRPTRSSNLRILSPNTESILDHIINGERPCVFADPVAGARESGLSSEKGTDKGRHARVMELLCEAEDSETQSAILRNLFRRSRTDFEERGVRILHVTAGMLEWTDPQSKEQVRSPLVLIPVELQRASSRDPFTLRTCEDETVLNPALVAKLAKDYRLVLPGVPDDLASTSVADYLTSIQQLVAKWSWVVRDEAWLGLFSFLKLVMYQDLLDNEGAIGKVPLIQALSGAPVDPKVFGESVPDPYELDSSVTPASSYLAVDADSSQLACVEAVKRGTSLVLQGPPGTGKSQTICNIISESIAAGKSVLFVSEKMAALEVVHKRLKECNLNSLVLELHSQKANKREVVQELARCLRERTSIPNGLTEDDLGKLAQRLERLNQYVRALHLVRKPLKRSVYQVLSRLAGLSSHVTVLSPYRNCSDLSPSTLDDIVQICRSISLVWHVALAGERYPWFGLKEPRFDVDVRFRHQTSIKKAIGLLANLQSLGSRVSSVLGLGIPNTLESCEFTSDLGALLDQSPGVDPDWVCGDIKTWSELSTGHVNRLIEALKGWGSSRSDLWAQRARRMVDAHSALEPTVDLDAATTLDLKGLLKRFQGPYRSVLKYFSLPYYRDTDTLRGVLTARSLPPNVVSLLKQLVDFQELYHQFKEALNFVQAVSTKTRGTPVSIEFARLASDAKEIPIIVKEFAEGLRETTIEVTSVSDHFDKRRLPAMSTSLKQASLDDVQISLKLLLESLDQMRDWIVYRSAIERASQMGISYLLEECRSGCISADNVAGFVEKGVLQSWYDWVCSHEPILTEFRRQHHETLIEEFRRLDTLHWKLGASRVLELANQKRPPIDILYKDSEPQILLQEANKKRRHLPIRQLFEQIPKLLTRLKPVLLMSPVSVSQFLSPTMLFDLVVFDEASQICAEDAVGALSRGKQAVICGDSQQLPPTSFFQVGEGDEYDDLPPEEDVAEYESVLKNSESAGLQSLRLQWHYRSKHEALIAFSNRQFYESGLTTFPSRAQKHPHMGVRLEHVEEGQYDRGGKRDNPVEAERVVDLVFRHYAQTPERSLGVVAFSVAQANAIENHLEKRLARYPEIEALMQKGRLEGFFVKNLENVQGDERDVVIFSVGYGRDKFGKMAANFGPLNRSGGEKRLNVAITRAREQVIVVSSIRAGEVQVGHNSPPGVRNIQKYLDYAERGDAALELSHSQGDSESPLEADISNVIRSFGYEPVPQVGCSGYRIDIGVVDPSKPGEYVLGVECDGATYHSAATARDRDRLRQQVLERLGWRIHRVWSPDWFRYREKETQLLYDAIRNAGQGSVSTSAHSETSEDVPEVRIESSEPGPNEAGIRAWLSTYEPVNTSELPGIPDIYDPWSRNYVASAVEAVVSREGPVHIEIVIDRIRQSCGFARAGSKIKSAIESAVEWLRRSGSIRRRTDFLWPKDEDKPLRVRIPSPGKPETNRRPHQISPEEYTACIHNVVSESLGIFRDALVIEVSRIFGFARAGSHVEAPIVSAVDSMIKRGILRETDGRVMINE